MDEGRYDNCILKEATFGTTSKGTPVFALTFDIGNGVARTVSLYYSDKARERTNETLASLGFNGDPENPRFRDDLYETGTALRMKHEMYEEKQQEKWYIDSGFVRPATSDQVQNFKSEWRANYGTKPPSANKPAPGKTAAQAKAPPARSAPARKKDDGDVLDTSSVTDKQSAFDFATKNNKELTDEKWIEAIEKREQKSKRSEDDFKAEDWKEIAASLSIPF